MKRYIDTKRLTYTTSKFNDDVIEVAEHLTFESESATRTIFDMGSNYVIIKIRKENSALQSIKWQQKTIEANDNFFEMVKHNSWNTNKLVNLDKKQLLVVVKVYELICSGVINVNIN